MAKMHVISGVGDKLDMPVIHQISLADLGDVLRRGAADFWAKPSHYVLLMLIYPIIGIVLTDRRAARVKSAEEAGDAAE